MSPLARRVLRSLRRRGLLTADERVAIAVSGGSDSVALVFLLREIAAAGDLQVAGLVHLNHGLRGQESNDDEAFCRARIAAFARAGVTQPVIVPFTPPGADRASLLRTLRAFP